MDNRLGYVLWMKDDLGDSSHDRKSILYVLIITHLFFVVIYQQNYNYIMLWPLEPDQANTFERIEHYLEETIWSITIHGYPTINIADLVSSSGHNALIAAKTIIKSFENKV